MKPDLSVKISSLELKNPVLTASGTFGYGLEYKDCFDPALLGGIVTKTVTLEPRMGNPMPRIAETPAGMLNSIGLANVGVDQFIVSKLPELEGLDTAVVANIADALPCPAGVERNRLAAPELNLAIEEKTPSAALE